MASRGKKVLIGLGIGCGGLILLVVVVIAIFASWVTRPGELLEPETLIGSDTIGFVEWTLSLEDPGTKEFVEGFFDKAEGSSAGQTPLPAELEKILLGWQKKSNRKKMEQMFPLSLGWTLAPGHEPEEDLHLFSLSLKNAGNRLVFTDWMLGLTLGFSNASEVSKIQYKDENIYQFGMASKTLVVFLRGNDLFFTYDLDTAYQAVDRLVDPATPAAGATDLQKLFARAPEEQPLRGALTNGRRELFRVWERIAVHVEDREALQEMTDQLRGAVLVGSLESDGRLRGKLELLAPDADWALENQEAALRALKQGFEYEGLALEATSRAEGEWIQIEFSLAGFLGFVDRLDDGRVFTID